jgi:hypothetical protein
MHTEHTPHCTTPDRSSAKPLIARLKAGATCFMVSVKKNKLNNVFNVLNWRRRDRSRNVTMSAQFAAVMARVCGASPEAERAAGPDA